MLLGEIIKKHRKKYSISQRQFALACGVSNGYISMLEKNINPSTGLPVAPSLSALKKIANAMNMTLNELMLLADDIIVDLAADNLCNIPLNGKPPSAEAEGGKYEKINRMLDKLTPEQKLKVEGFIECMVYENEAADAAKQISDAG